MLIHQILRPSLLFPSASRAPSSDFETFSCHCALTDMLICTFSVWFFDSQQFRHGYSHTSWCIALLPIFTTRNKAQGTSPAFSLTSFSFFLDYQFSFFSLLPPHFVLYPFCIFFACHSLSENKGKYSPSLSFLPCILLLVHPLFLWSSLMFSLPNLPFCFFCTSLSWFSHPFFLLLVSPLILVPFFPFFLFIPPLLVSLPPSLVLFFSAKLCISLSLPAPLLSRSSACGSPLRLCFFLLFQRPSVFATSPFFCSYSPLPLLCWPFHVFVSLVASSFHLVLLHEFPVSSSSDSDLSSFSLLLVPSFRSFCLSSVQALFSLCCSLLSHKRGA